MNRSELVAEVTRLRELGYTRREIADMIGISLSYVSHLINDPTGVKLQGRRESYAGVCQDCGGRTNGSDGPGKAGKRCFDCQMAYQRANRKWTAEAIIDAVQRWAAAHDGRPPVANDWITKDWENDYPPRSACYRSTGTNPSAPFQNWADVIEAAGFPRPRVGVRTPEGEARRVEKMRLRGYYRHTDEEILDLIREQATDGVAAGSFDNAVYRSAKARFGSWLAACELAGVRPRRPEQCKP